MGIAFRFKGMDGGEIFTEDGAVVRKAITGQMTQTGEQAVKGVVDELRAGAEEVQKSAIDYAPFSEESDRLGYPHLQDAIEVREERDSKNRLAFTVFVNGRRTGHNGKTVGAYAYMVHEGMLPEGSGEINRGKGTQAKGDQAGGKFLERAFRDHADRIKARVEARAKAFFRKR